MFYWRQEEDHPSQITILMGLMQPPRFFFLILKAATLKVGIYTEMDCLQMNEIRLV